jgi:alkylation response protein AidB-like acyl-CoA dehydrogenase
VCAKTEGGYGTDKINQIFEGTNQIQRMIIARQLLGEGMWLQ